MGDKVCVVVCFLAGCHHLMKALGFVSLGLRIGTKRIAIGLEFGVWTKFVLGNEIYTLPLLTFCHWFKS